MDFLAGYPPPAGLPHCFTLDFSQSVLVRSWGMDGDPVPAGKLGEILFSVM